MLYVAWFDDPFRPTGDLDFLGLGDAAEDLLVETFREVSAMPVEDDGIVVAPEAVTAAPIRALQNLSGVRINAWASLGTARISLKADIGFGDAVTPAARELEFPVLLDMPAPLIRSYPPETVVAEKFETMVSIGRRTSRMKDFYDLLALSRLLAFDGQTLSAAIRATFERRQTSLPIEPPTTLGPDFALDPNAQAQWGAFINRALLLIEPLAFPEVIDEISAFVMPPVIAATGGDAFAMAWLAGGPWREP